MLGRARPARGVASGRSLKELATRAAVLAMGGAVLFPALAQAMLPATSAAWAEEQLVITTDNGGAPLVSASKLAPGPMPPRCLKINYTGAVADQELRFFVSADTSHLAQYIDVTIEQGQGGRSGDCSQFTGTSVFTGTLAALAQQYHEQHTALPIARLNAGAGEVSLRFRFAIRDDNRAQGRSVTSDFTWVAGDDFAPAGTVDPGGNPPAKLGPSVTVPFTGPSLPPSKPVPSLPARQDPQAAESPPKKAPLAGALESFRDKIARISKPLAKGAAFGLLTLPLVAAFLLFQHFIDRRDPKLANAPSAAEPDLEFSDTPTAST